MHRRPRAYGTIVRSVFTAKRRSLVEGNECKRDLRTTEIIAKVDGHYHGITDHGFSLRNLRPFSRPAGLDLVGIGPWRNKDTATSHLGGPQYGGGVSAMSLIRYFNLGCP